jgi:hypothetical protein
MLQHPQEALRAWVLQGSSSLMGLRLLWPGDFRDQASASAPDHPGAIEAQKCGRRRQYSSGKPAN